MDAAPIVGVTYPAPPEQARVIEDALLKGARVEFVAGQEDAPRARVLGEAEALLAWRWSAEIRPEERPVLGRLRFLQLISAGADGLPFGEIPKGVTVAGNVGAYAEPMAEHVQAMALALAKRLPQRHAEMARGEFDSYAPSMSLDGAVCAILGYGGIGRAVARLMPALGARIHAINTTGRAEEGVERAGTLDDLDAVLGAADVLVICLPLTVRTRGLIGARELGLMKPDAILVNVARGAIVDEAALYEHLRTHPEFRAGLDVWWHEPPDGRFRTDHPFFELPNLLGSPHNSAIVPGVLETAARRAAENVGRYLRGEPFTGLMRREDYEETNT